MRYLFILFGGIGVFALALAGFFFLSEQNFLATAETASGQVTQLEISTDAQGSAGYCPVIEFTSQQGQPVRFTGDNCAAPSEFQVGDRVQVIYDPANPRNAQAQSISDEYLGTIVSGLVGLPFLLIGIVGVVAARFKTNRRQPFGIQAMR